MHPWITRLYYLMQLFVPCKGSLCRYLILSQFILSRDALYMSSAIGLHVTVFHVVVILDCVCALSKMFKLICFAFRGPMRDQISSQPLENVSPVCLV